MSVGLDSQHGYETCTGYHSAADAETRTQDAHDFVVLSTEDF